MVVNFTSNVALAKPTESELAANWVNLTKLQEDNNIILANETNKVTTTWTPIIKAQTSDPNIGSGGGQNADYQDIQGMIFGRFMISFFGSGISIGSGEYAVSLPAVADNSFHTVGTAFNATPGS